MRPVPKPRRLPRVLFPDQQCSGVHRDCDEHVQVLERTDVWPTMKQCMAVNNLRVDVFNSGAGMREQVVVPQLSLSELALRTC